MSYDSYLSSLFLNRYLLKRHDNSNPYESHIRLVLTKYARQILLNHCLTLNTRLSLYVRAGLDIGFTT